MVQWCATTWAAWRGGKADSSLPLASDVRKAAMYRNFGGVSLEKAGCGGRRRIYTAALVSAREQ